MRLALFTLESAASSGAVRRFATAHASSLVLCGLSDPYRPASGGALGQMRRHLRRSGPRILPYLAANFSVPELLHRRPLARFCRERGIASFVVRDINGEAAHAAIRAARPDLIVSFHFDQIFTAETLALAPGGGINVHPALLPQHRGPMPTFWAALEQPPCFGVTVHRLAERIDAGAVLEQRAVGLPEGTSVSTAARKLHEAGVELLGATVAALRDGTARETAVPVLPYCPFPDAATLREAARRGVRLVDAADWRAAAGR